MSTAPRPRAWCRPTKRLLARQGAPIRRSRGRCSSTGLRAVVGCPPVACAYGEVSAASARRPRPRQPTPRPGGRQSLASQSIMFYFCSHGGNLSANMRRSTNMPRSTNTSVSNGRSGRPRQRLRMRGDATATPGVSAQALPRAFSEARADGGTHWRCKSLKTLNSGAVMAPLLARARQDGLLSPRPTESAVLMSRGGTERRCNSLKRLVSGAARLNKADPAPSVRSGAGSRRGTIEIPPGKRWSGRRGPGGMRPKPPGESAARC